MGLIESTPVSADGNAANRGGLMISQGIIPPQDENKFASLLQETSLDKEKLKEIMKEVGSNNYDKGLNKVEFTRVAEALGLFEKAKTHGFSKEILADLYFDMFDSDKDQNVNFFEFVSGFATINKSTSVEDKASLLFRMYDINGDGKITRSEMRQAVKRFLESVRKMKKAQYQQMAKFMEDKSINNYSYVLEQPISEEQVNKVVDSAFSMADVNKDELITKDEFVTWVKSSPEVRSQLTKLGLE
jgi:Ca2+-binding EF-hand superfamily protein